VDITFFRYGMVGGSALLVDGIIFYILHYSSLGLDIHPSRILAFLISACVAWYFHKIFTFKSESKKRYIIQLGKFLLGNGSGIFLNYLVFSIGIYFQPSNEGVMISFLAGSGLAFIYNYAISRYIIFKK